MARLVAVVLTLALAVTTVLGADTSGAVGVTLGALLLAAVVAWCAGDRPVPARVCTTAGPVGQERCLRGSFRPQSSPDAPGRPRPRAPGNGRRPA